MLSAVFAGLAMASLAVVVSQVPRTSGIIGTTLNVVQPATKTDKTSASVHLNFLDVIGINDTTNRKLSTHAPSRPKSFEKARQMAIYSYR